MERETHSRKTFFGMGEKDYRHFGVMPGLLGGRDPFNDPFFTRPFGGMIEFSRFEHPSFARAATLIVEFLKHSPVITVFFLVFLVVADALLTLRMQDVELISCYFDMGYLFLIKFHILR